MVSQLGCLISWDMGRTGWATATLLLLTINPLPQTAGPAPASAVVTHQQYHCNG